MRSYPVDKYDQEELAALSPEPWMLELLKLNPPYTSWGPHEDYMWTRGDKEKASGWDGEIINETWNRENPFFNLDDLNECVNFYFEISRPSVDCEYCYGTGNAPFAYQQERSFYDFEGRGDRWCDNITQEDADALWKAGRLSWFQECPTAAQVNEWSRGPGIGHAAINLWIMVQARCKKVGEPVYCEHCHDGSNFIATAHVNLILWILHPRKGCSRGVEFTKIQQEDLPSIFKFLAEAAQRNAMRFERVVEMVRV